MTEHLHSLLERCERATGASVELDGAIWGALVAEPRCSAPEKIGAKYPPYTASTDAALALAWKKHPGWVASIDISTKFDGRSSVYFNPHMLSRTPLKVFGNTPALAVCIALLRALTPEGEKA